MRQGGLKMKEKHEKPNVLVDNPLGSFIKRNIGILIGLVVLFPFNKKYASGASPDLY